jgi:hypothetical protein
VIDYLEAELSGVPRPPPPKRMGKALFYFVNEQPFIEAIVDIEKGIVVSQRVLEGKHGPGDDEEMKVVGA